VKINRWIPASISILATCLWAYWGIIENFHEGWYLPTLAENLGLMFVQYLSPMLVFILLTIVSNVRAKIGAFLHFGAALFSAWFFRGGSGGTVMLVASLFSILGALYWFSGTRKNRTILLLALILPLSTAAAFGIAPLLRVLDRSRDVDLSAQYIPTDDFALLWAPSGPGWPKTGENWHAAARVCRYLNADGTQIESTGSNIWRLPEVEEAVLSMRCRGKACGGSWDDANGKAAYDHLPDKDMPLWDIYSPVIYWWTSSEVDGESAYMIAYDGRVWPRKKSTAQTYLGFRCVRDAVE